MLASDHSALLRNAVNWALNEPANVSVSGRGLFDVTAWRQKQSLTVHLVNLTNPMTMKGPYRELVATGPLRVRITLPQSTKARAVHLLVSGQALPLAQSDGQLVVDVPTIADHEVVAVDL